MNEKNELAVVPQKKSILSKFSSRYNVDPAQMNDALKQTAFRQAEGKIVTDAQMIALLVVADQYGLNPFTKEIYAYPDKGGIVPVVSVDGWDRIINESPQLETFSFRYSEDFVELEDAKPCPEWIECVIKRKDRSDPIAIREYLDECYKPPYKGETNGKPWKKDGPWQSHTKRMLRHKALIQSARIVFGFAGIYDEDDASRIVDATVIDSRPLPKKPCAKIEAPKTQEVEQPSDISALTPEQQAFADATK